jgi:hypothetical protein
MQFALLGVSLVFALGSCISDRASEGLGPVGASAGSVEAAAEMDARDAADIALKKARGEATDEELERLESYLSGEGGQ